MDEISIVKLVFGIIIAIGLLTTFWAFTSAVNESLEHARNLDINKWGESLVRMFLVGITLFFAGVIAEIFLFFGTRNRGQIN